MAWLTWLILLPLAHLAAVAEASSSFASQEHETRAQALFDAWSQAYGLENTSTLLPPSPLALPPNVPPPPHLEDCAARTAARQAAEERGEGGTLPAWARGEFGECCGGSEGDVENGGKGESAGSGGSGGRGDDGRGCCNCGPQPPWIRGSDAANLAMTRGVQRDMWRHQFPASCTGRRLMLSRWPNLHHGMGSMVHVVGAYLSIAMRSNRTLVLMPGTFERAGRECEDLRQAQQWECYFFPIASPGCVQEAMAAHGRGEAPDIRGNDVRESMLGGDTQVVYLALSSLYGDVDAAKLQRGKPWLDRPYTVQQQNSISSMYPDWMMARWWRAQAARFLLRWPSAHLCHVINRVRHVSYGHLMADRVAAVAAQQASIVQSLNDTSGAISTATSDASSAASSAATSAASSAAERGDPLDDLLLLVAAKAKAAEREMPASNGSATPNSTDAGGSESIDMGGGSEGSGSGDSGVGGEVLMVRPVVSMHVRLSDKGSEMQLHPLPAFMLVAARLRQHQPDLKHVWLSTEVQVRGEGRGVGDGSGEAVEARDEMHVRLSDKGSEMELHPLPAFMLVAARLRAHRPDLKHVWLSTEVQQGMQVHVRLSDKASEMELHPLPAFMLVASRLRQHQPDLKHAWLSTEVQSVIDETSDFPSWTFFYTNASRVQSAQQMKDEQESAQQPIANIFANLLITAECDYFIGSLGSNWNRLIDELRSSNGRLYSGLVSFTFGM
ncbi:unnamed protein product [Closterium sp. Naga37s-1]|nr:unnamed protein product [Closterium sp. Naga37s-1]